MSSAEIVRSRAQEWKAQQSRSRSLRRVLSIVRRQPLGVAAGVILMIIIVVAIAAPLIAPYDPYEVHPVDSLQGPNAAYLLGTDDLGRDLLSRTIYGARISLEVGILAVAVGVSAGVLIGLVSGYVGGWVDMIIQRISDAFMAFPALILAMAVVSVLGSGLDKIIWVIAIVMIAPVGRVMRSSVLAVRQEAYVEAAIASGASHLRVMVRHILPNVAAPIIVLVSVLMGAAILIEAGLSFLGLGIKPPEPSWGTMLSGVGAYYARQSPHLALVPGAAISITVLALNLLGDALRDELDPRLQGTR